MLRGRPLPTDRAAVMAIVNRTPDSFFDAGATYADGAALDAVQRAVDEGADIVDIGGVKAGVGREVDVAEETRRVVPFIARVRDAVPRSGDQCRHLAVAGGGGGLRGRRRPDQRHLGRRRSRVGARWRPGSGPASSARTPAAPRRGPTRIGWPIADVVAAVIAETTAAAARMVAAGVPPRAC